MVTPLHTNPCPGDRKFTIFVDSSFVIITTHIYFFICSMSRSRDGDFKGNNVLPLHD